ncbi:hypothetical protein BD770DRAFT_393463 [Pilaira anomala]|nr:hypothetical protein BD770DRAFT_393463 [Pilaira anomala]
MLKSILIGILMPVLVFTILLYTCYQYVYNVHSMKLYFMPSRYILTRLKIRFFELP